MNNRITAMLLVVGTILFGFGTTAQAYPPESSTVEVAGPLTGGKDVEVTVQNCLAGEAVEFYIDGKLVDTSDCVDDPAQQTEAAAGATDVPESGIVSAQAAVPTEPGVYQGEVRMVESGVTRTFTLEVPDAALAGAQPAGTDGVALPATGSNGVNSTVAIAIALLAFGVALFVVAHRRRDDTSVLEAA